MMRAEREILLSLRNEGEVDDTVVRSLQHELDLEEALLTQFEDADIADEELREVVVGRPRVPAHGRGSDAPPPDELACPDCVELGWEWVHLRQCLACGRVGCCDSSRAATPRPTGRRRTTPSCGRSSGARRGAGATSTGSSDEAPPRPGRRLIGCDHQRREVVQT